MSDAGNGRRRAPHGQALVLPGHAQHPDAWHGMACSRPSRRPIDPRPPALTPSTLERHPQRCSCLGHCDTAVPGHGDARASRVHIRLHRWREPLARPPLPLRARAATHARRERRRGMYLVRAMQVRYRCLDNRQHVQWTCCTVSAHTSHEAACAPSPAPSRGLPRGW